VLAQQPIPLMHLDPLIVEPPIQAAHEALRLHGAAVHVGGPGRETDHSGLNQTPQPPGQGLEMPAIDPVFMLAADVHQRIRETRRALQIDPPWKMVVPQSV
jgi:hypothetical protein